MSETRSDERLAVYSDYVCPFCYLGKVAMEEYLDDAEDPPDVDWRFYDLQGYKRGPDGEIDRDVDDGKDDDYFAEVRENVAKLADRYDVDVSLDRSLEVDSWDAQQVALYVREELGEEPFRDLHERLFDALWRDGADIGDPEVLRELVTEVDLDRAVVDEALTDEWERELEARFDAAQGAGVTGIPTFVYDGHAARGAIPPEQFERLVRG